MACRRCPWRRSGATNIWTALITLLLLSRERHAVDAAIACNETHNPCEELLFKGSECRDGFCSNPFEKGCLNTLLNEEYGGDNDLLPSLARRLREQIRVCNSEDPPEARGIVCIDHQSAATAATGQGGSGQADLANIYSDYTEIRILSQNWESAFFSSWVMQILLSEVLQVPTTIETGTADAKVNFYSPTNDFGYGKNNDWGAIATANEAPYGDCRFREESSAEGAQPVTGEKEEEQEYVSCGHVMTEFWGGNNLKDLWNNHRDGVVDAPGGLGAIGQQGLYVTKFTAVEEPTVLNLLGIAGEGNRRKLAELFLRPTTWKDYCEIVSETNCTVPDGVAERPPNDESEYNRMHVPGAYIGHFRKTEQNDCDANPTTCTGHVADFPCGWSSYLQVQTYHHNIALESNGPEPGSNGYTYGQLVDMYAAANATKSNLMTMWWQPEALYSTYLATDAEMQRVVLPSPTEECVDNRIRIAQRCDYANDEERYGDAAGACDEAPQLLQKVVAQGLYRATYENSAISPARQSPAYEAIKAFQISELQLGSILQDWIFRGVDTYGFDPRLATCQWVRDNLAHIEDFIPRTYPRVAEEQDILKSPLFYVAAALGGIATIMTAVVTILTYRRRNGYVMRFSQWEFLLLLLLGLLLVSVGSILLVIPPTDVSCVAVQWLVGLGYTLELVPLIVKVGAMNRMMTAAKKFKRIILTQRQLFGTVALFVSIMVIFLCLWSTLDAPERKGEYTLTGETTENGEYVVEVGYYCSSQSVVWRYLAVLWHCILLICATVLAFQTRKLQAGFSESAVLAVIIYTHFVFVMLRVITFLLGGALLESQVAGFRSLIYSVDALATLCVYFVPKLLTDDEKFYNLTHTAQSSRGGRGSVLTMNPHTIVDGRGSVIGSSAPLAAGGSSGAFGSSGRSKPSGEDDTHDSTRLFGERDEESVPTRTSKSTKSGRGKSKKKKDVLHDSRVSWGGINLTTVMKSIASSRASEAADEEYNEHSNAPFKKPVDVLKGSNSWGGAHVTMLIHSEDEGSDNGHNHAGSSGDLDVISETNEPSSDLTSGGERKSLLAPASLPSVEEHSERFSYASSRISRARHVHHPDTYDDEGEDAAMGESSRRARAA